MNPISIAVARSVPGQIARDSSQFGTAGISPRLGSRQPGYPGHAIFSLFQDGGPGIPAFLFHRVLSGLPTSWPTLVFIGRFPGLLGAFSAGSVFTLDPSPGFHGGGLPGMLSVPATNRVFSGGNEGRSSRIYSPDNGFHSSDPSPGFQGWNRQDVVRPGTTFSLAFISAGFLGRVASLAN